MSLHEDLLETARDLASWDPRRPKQASLRCAISTAYYALFHLLTFEASKKIAPRNPDPLRGLVMRAFRHAHMKKVCSSYASGGKLPVEIEEVSPSPVAPNLIKVARYFKDLQEARHIADYDTNQTFTRAVAVRFINMAKAAFASWETVRETEQATVFLMALLLSDHWKR